MGLWGNHVLLTLFRGKVSLTESSEKPPVKLKPSTTMSRRFREKSPVFSYLKRKGLDMPCHAYPNLLFMWATTTVA